MKKVGTKSLAKALTLSLLLAGVYQIPMVSAADPDAKGTVTSSGSYNSITADPDNSTRGTDHYIFGINGNGSPVTITMTGDSIISVTDTGQTGSDARDALVTGVYNTTSLVGSGEKGITIDVTAHGGDHNTTGTARSQATLQGIYANSYTTNVDGNIVVNAKNTAGNATSGTGAANALSTTSAIYSLNNSKINVDGNVSINSNSTGGNAISNSTTLGHAKANLSDNGIMALSNSKINITGNYNFSAKDVGGTATTSASGNNQQEAVATAQSHALYANNNSKVTIKGNVNINSYDQGGSAKAVNGIAHAYGRSIGLMAGQDSTINISGSTTIKVKAVGGNAKFGNNTDTGLGFDEASNARGIAIGIFSNNRGVNTLSGNVDIDTSARVQQAGEQFNAHSLEAHNGGINDLSSTGKTKILVGDIVADTAGINKLNLDTNGSYLQGNIVTDSATNTTNPGDNQVTISNGAEWRPVYDNRYGTDCVASADANANTINVATNTVDTRSTDDLTLKDGGKVNLLWDGDRTTYRTINIGTLSGNGGEFDIKTDLNSETNGDKINVTTGEAGSTQYITVDDASLDNGTTTSGNKKLLVATDKSGKYTFAGKTLDTGGLWETTPTIENLEGNNWYLVMLKAEPNPSTRDLIGTFESGYGFWRSTILDDTLRKRLGDLRYENEDMSGLWARVKAGKLSASTYDGSYQKYQVGLDKKTGNSIYGFAVDYSRNNNDLTSGVGEGSNTGLSLYATNYHDSGAYSTVVLRAGKLRMDMHSNGTYKDYFDYDAWGYSASYELGKTFRKDNGWFIEPQAQLIYGHLGGGDYTTDRGVIVNRDGINSFIGRLGFALGRKVNKNADYYFKANVYREFGGSGDMNLVYGSQKMNYDGDHKDTWFEMGIGTNVKLNNNTYFYGDILKTFGADINKKWQVNAGIRWMFGGPKKAKVTETIAPKMAPARVSTLAAVPKVDYYMGSVHFDSDQDVIRPDQQGKVIHFAEVAKENPNHTFKLVGNTDNDASDSYNEDLSRRRVESVKKAAEQKGVPAYQMQTNYSGEKNPASSNATAQGKADNRRVDMWEHK